jgi:hypothetical protein
MSSILTNPSVVPSAWILEILDIERDEFYAYIDPSTNDSIELSLATVELSDDPDDVMSAIVDLMYITSHDLDPEGLVVNTANQLTTDRWVELVSMRVDVMRECVRMFILMHTPPNSSMVESIGASVIRDITSVNILTQIWIDQEWPLTLEFVYITQASFLCWEFLDRFRYTDETNSFELVSEIANQVELDSSVWGTNAALISVNGAALEYLIHLDTLYADGIESTIQTIEDFDLWEIIMFNPAASPIIDRMMLESSYDNDEDEDIRSWLIPLISGSEIVGNYATIDDIRNELVDEEKFFVNPSAIDIIEQWVIKEGVITEKILVSLVDIAKQGNQAASIKSINLLNNHLTQDGSPAINMISIEQLTELLCSEHAADFAKSVLGQTGTTDMLDGLLRRKELVPYWDTGRNHEWRISNLTSTTVENMSSEFRGQLARYVAMVSYDNWIVLLKTEFGVGLGLKHTELLADKGVLFALLGSSFVTKDQLSELHRTTHLFDCCDDIDFISLISRDDIYDIDLRIIKKINSSICRELLSTWYHPDRLVRLAGGSDIRKYLNQFD